MKGTTLKKQPNLLDSLFQTIITKVWTETNHMIKPISTYASQNYKLAKKAIYRKSYINCKLKFLRLTAE